MATVTETAPAEVEALLRLLDLGRMTADLNRLCDVEFAGRRVSSLGHDLAQAWLAMRMQLLGLTVEIVPFTLATQVLDVYDTPLFEFTDEQRRLRYRIDYAEHPRSSDLPQPTENLPWAILDSVPRGEQLDNLAASYRRGGVAGLLVPQFRTQSGFLSKRIVARPPNELPLIAVAPDLLPELQRKRLRIKLPLRRLTAVGGHVVGTISGSDPQLTQQPILVGGHYDALGDDTGGLRLPGAADNAAAVAVVLELARVLSSATPPRRPISFAAFDAEEVDALGTHTYARALAKAGVRPLVINLDMAAQLHKAVLVEPGASPTRTLAALDQAGEWLGQPLVLGDVSSDNRRFAQVGLQTVGIGLGGNDIHTPADTPENVNPPAMLAAARLLLTTVWQLARQ